MFSVLKIVSKSRSLVYQSVRCFQRSPMLAAEELEKLKKNPYFEKYQQKIAGLQQVSPGEFLEKLTASAKDRKLKEGSGQVSAPGPAVRRDLPDYKRRALKDILKLELLEGKSTEEITKIWAEYHTNKDRHLSAIVPGAVYDTISGKAKQFHTFLLPLPRDNGYEFFVVQFLNDEFHFTSLINYQAHQENAPECLTMTYFTDFKEGSNVVLMRGEYDKKILSGIEAQCLANQIQLYYSGKDEKKTRLLECFTLRPGDFRHMDLVREMEEVVLTQ